jgi:hypothetical protein
MAHPTTSCQPMPTSNMAPQPATASADAMARAFTVLRDYASYPHAQGVASTTSVLREKQKLSLSRESRSEARRWPPGPVSRSLLET